MIWYDLSKTPGSDDFIWPDLGFVLSWDPGTLDQSGLLEEKAPIGARIQPTLPLGTGIGGLDLPFEHLAVDDDGVTAPYN